MLISILGAGYVGLVTAACLARLGHGVRVVDIDADRVARLRAGELPIHEPNLPELVAEGVAAGRLEFHAEQGAADGTSLGIIAVDTLDASGRWTDTVVRHAVRSLAEDGAGPRWIVVRSTLMPGTSASLLAEARRADGSIELGHNPEFTREGSAVADFLAPDRIVFGLEDGRTDSALARALDELYQPLQAPRIVTDLASAEAIKVGSNVFLATKIAYANELARLCAAVGADVATVVDAIGLDRRIGRAFLSPGPGFGGACLPSQSRALPDVARALDVDVPLMASLADSNDAASAWQVRVLTEQLGRPLDGATVALLGVAFKAGTDDVRESPALRIGRLLGERGARLNIYDPLAGGAGVERLVSAGVAAARCTDVISAAQRADALMVVTEWPEFGSLDWGAIAAAMRGRLVVDARKVIDASAARGAGLDLVVMGRAAGGERADNRRPSDS